MKRTSTRMRLCTALLICLLVFIWGNSLMPGPVSQAISNFVQKILFRTELTPGEIPAGNTLLRKMAHFTEFAALGFLLCWRFGMLKKPVKYAVFSGITAACIDEGIQAFTPDRACRLYDVAIDSLGILTGIALLHYGHTYLKKRRSA